jgi:LPXTG-motif cell wall-anchored protein
MYEHDQVSGMLTAIFVAAGLVLLALGWWLFRKYRDDRPRDQKGFRDFGLGPRGLLAYGGIVLMVLGGASCLVGLFLPAILR